MWEGRRRGMRIERVGVGVSVWVESGSGLEIGASWEGGNGRVWVACER